MSPGIWLEHLGFSGLLCHGTLQMLPLPGICLSCPSSLLCIAHRAVLRTKQVCAGYEAALVDCLATKPSGVLLIRFGVIMLSLQIEQDHSDPYRGAGHMKLDFNTVAVTTGCS